MDIVRKAMVVGRGANVFTDVVGDVRVMFELLNSAVEIFSTVLVLLSLTRAS